MAHITRRPFAPLTRRRCKGWGARVKGQIPVVVVVAAAVVIVVIVLIVVLVV